jgi:hypothetical protein
MYRSRRRIDSIDSTGTRARRRPLGIKVRIRPTPGAGRSGIVAMKRLFAVCGKLCATLEARLKRKECNMSLDIFVGLIRRFVV